MLRIDFYTDYRKFLADFLEDARSRFSFFSYRYFCKKAGIVSPSLFREVMTGKRSLTSSTIASFAKGLGLNEADTAYFEALVHFNQSKSPRDKQKSLQQMRGLRQRVRQKLIPLDHYEYFEHWYNPVIRELACVLEWGDNYLALARAVAPPISKKQAHRSVEMLLRLGFLGRDDTGKYIQKDPAITTGPEVASVAVRELNRQMAGLGLESIDRFSPSDRDVSNMVVGVSRKGYEQIKEEIREFKRRIVGIVDDDKCSDRIYAINVQAFPMSLKKNVPNKDTTHENETEKRAD
jgi:uncharacterized protein (TIGR02147 family)